MSKENKKLGEPGAISLGKTDEPDLALRKGGNSGNEQSRRDENPDDASLRETNLAVTALAFHSRMKKKKQEQQRVLDDRQERSRIRHKLMLQSLLTIRTSLSDVERLDLGERFGFTLTKDDWQGWPRLVLNLRDASFPEKEYPNLSVTAHDRKERGIIEIDFDPNEKPELLSMANDKDVKRLPSTLRRCVRRYLDIAGEVVLQAESEPKLADDDPLAEPKELLEKKKGIGNGTSSTDSEKIDSDLFEDDLGEENVLETLPTLKEVRPLCDTSDVEED